MGGNISGCKYYSNGMCKVFGENAMISCATVSNMTPEACKNGSRGSKKRKNSKRNKREYS